MWIIGGPTSPPTFWGMISCTPYRDLYITISYRVEGELLIHHWAAFWQAIQFQNLFVDKHSLTEQRKR